MESSPIIDFGLVKLGSSYNGHGKHLPIHLELLASD